MNKKFFTVGATAVVILSTIASSNVAFAHGRHNDGYQGGYYSNSAYEDRDDDGGYRERENQRQNNYRNRNYDCRSKGTGGLVIGAVVGGLLGRKVAGRYGDRTAGAIVGAGAGALAGRAIDRAGSNRC
jgi:outer membrane lipoprotein SlyB